MIVSNRVYLYGKKDMDSLAARRRYEFQYDLQLIEVGIDPSGGGSQSEYTIVSKCMENGNDIVSHNLTNSSRTNDTNGPVCRWHRL